MAMFGRAFHSFFQNYFNFSGRATRSEFWCMVPVLMVLYILMGTGLVSDVVRWLFPASPMENAWGYDGITTAIMVQQIIQTTLMLAMLFMMIPALSLFVRRMHDAGYSEWRLLTWWIMLPLFIGMIPSYFGMGASYIMEWVITLSYDMLVVYGIILLSRPSHDKRL